MTCAPRCHLAKGTRGAAHEAVRASTGWFRTRWHDVLGAWYATVLNVNSLRLVVWLSEPSNLTVVTRARRAEFPAQLTSALKALLVRLQPPSILPRKNGVRVPVSRF
jgi:hypothetical protein